MYWTLGGPEIGERDLMAGPRFLGELAAVDHVSDSLGRRHGTDYDKRRETRNALSATLAVLPPFAEPSPYRPADSLSERSVRFAGPTQPYLVRETP